MNGLTSDQQLLQIVSGAAPTTIPAVIAVMQGIDNVLPGDDGLKWFNWLYLQVTQEIDTQPPAGGWGDAAWLERLDVVFAGLYFSAIANFLSDDSSHPAKSAQGGPSSSTQDGPPSSTPSSWRALFEARQAPGIDRIQFALAGMNAHINHDLALALIQANRDLGMSPGLDSPEHDDFERVNGLLEAVLPSTLTVLATGVLGELAQDTGKIGRLLAIWNVRAARELAWGFGEHLAGLDAIGRDVALDAQDRLTGVIGRSLLLPM